MRIRFIGLWFCFINPILIPQDRQSSKSRIRNQEDLLQLLTDQSGPKSVQAYQKLLQMVRVDPSDIELPRYILPPIMGPPDATKTFQKIVNVYRTAALKNPRNPNIQYNYGMILWSSGTGDPFNAGIQEQALIQLEKAAKLAPKKIDFRFQLAHYLELSDKYDRAIAEYEEVLRSEARDGFFAVSSHQGLANIYRSQRRFEQALTEYQKVIELDRENTSPSNKAYNAMGMIYLEQGKTDDALKMLKNARTVSLDPVLQSFGFECELGIALVRRGIYDPPIEYFLVALRATPDNDEPRYGLALAYTKKGEKAKALEEWKKYLTLDFAPRADEARSYIKELE